MGEIKYYEKRKREIEDRCNICGKISKLTWDHVPPKFCFNDGYAKYNSMMEVTNKEKKFDIVQNGIRFRSICDNCNNNILGANYDMEYKKLVDILYNIYIKPGEISQYIVIKGLKINKISRSIIGHLLAARNDYFDGSLENELRNYFLNATMLPPKKVKLLYYTYIYNTILIIRDISPRKFGNKEYEIPEGFISCLSSFPIAFILADQCDNNCGLYDMFELCTSNIEEEIDLRIDLLSYMYPNHKCSRSPYWPCDVHDGETGTSILLASECSQKHSVLSQIRNLKTR